MKIRRLKTGYHISVSQAEFKVICLAVANGLGDEPENLGISDPTEQKAWHLLARFDAFDVDE